MPESLLKSAWLKLVVAFAAVYLIWGSTYIAIKFALESMPPFLMVAFRFIIAGSLMYTFTRARGAARPEKVHLLPTFILGFLFLGVGGTGIVLAEKTLPTGLVSLLVANVPLYIVLIQWLKPGGSYPGTRILIGLALGVAGLLILVGPGKIIGGRIDFAGVAYVLIASICSAIAAVYSRTAVLPQSQQMSAGMQMIFGGVVILLVSACSGEFSSIQTLHITMKSFLALGYLIIFGSMVAFSAYVWLLARVNPSRVSTYAYVNPVVAIFLGWLLAHESITAETLIGTAVTLCAVWLITMTAPKPKFEPIALLALKNRETCLSESR